MAGRTSEPPAAIAGSFNRYGPFYRLQLKLGLLDARHLAVGRRAGLFAALALLSMVAVAATQMPFKDILAAVTKLMPL
ncbi:MAG: hypothetical protein ABIR94_24200 [Rubrivivax sp.]